MSGIITQINEGKDVNFIEVLTFRKDWLQTHILLEDKQYGPFLNKHGIR
jgi:hemerythrin